MEEISFDQAVELLEITDIKAVSTKDLPGLAKAAKKRWHPDTISHKGDSKEVERYTRNFQRIDEAILLIGQYLDGSIHAGQKRKAGQERTHQEPEEVIRQNGSEIQSTLRSIWQKVKATKYKWTEEEVVLSDGFRLKDLIDQDFEDDIAAMSLISFVYGVVLCGLVGLLLGLIAPPLGAIVGVFWLLQALSCLAGVLPISRFWMPKVLQGPMIWFVNFGLGIYHWARREAEMSDKAWLQLLVYLPALAAKAVKYLILWPTYAIAKLFIGDRVVGVVRKKVNYYGGYADWYVDQLIGKTPASMTKDELFDLSGLYSAFNDLKP